MRRAPTHSESKRPASPRALVGTRDPLIGALVGLLLESNGRAPIFAEPGEGLTDSLVRLRPVALVVVSVDMSEVHSDLFFARAEKMGARITIFGSRNQLREIAAVVSARGTAWFTVPPAGVGIERAIHSMDDRRALENPDRREDPKISISSDGTPVLVDRAGTRWLVYDRRVSRGRRQSRNAGVDRTFISEFGERFSYVLDEKLAGNAEPIAVEAQLASARSSSIHDR